ncbi:hypothetical protein [Candidatus Nitrosotenuis uzonensis]|uniref:Uncharacterized protein n=1 Tax=Candidatus Nitrosotenuis uzonensis TaxID=1407055 RepID=A0A812F1Y0_9ARCH|nr:hypothetical protein [Candidatus Nitrosotenuis uzonensis]CAE6486020.1 hypothetical protein NUZ5A_20083 [Candidatus Nitrosotenuis uzonensis]
MLNATAICDASNGFIIKSMSLEEASKEAAFAYKSPKSLPTGYSLEDAISHKGMITLLYSPKKICGPGQTAQTYSDGILKFITETPEQNNEISKGRAYFEEFKKYSDYPERISIFEINGNPAMGWESGMKKSIVKFDNGTVISEEDISYPAQLQIIDTTNQRFYVLKGYFQLDQLTQIAKSIG